MAVPAWQVRFKVANQNRVFPVSHVFAIRQLRWRRERSR
jgi:hypothetical protein